MLSEERTEMNIDKKCKCHKNGHSKGFTGKKHSEYSKMMISEGIRQSKKREKGQG